MATEAEIKKKKNKRQLYTALLYTHYADRLINKDKQKKESDNK